VSLNFYLDLRWLVFIRVVKIFRRHFQTYTLEENVTIFKNINLFRVIKVTCFRLV